MHQLEFEAWRQHREEMAHQIANDRLARRLRASRPKEGLLARLAGRFWHGAQGTPQAAG